MFNMRHVLPSEFISTTLPQRLGLLVKQAAAAVPPPTDEEVAASITKVAVTCDM